MESVLRLYPRVAHGMKPDFGSRRMLCGRAPAQSVQCVKRFLLEVGQDKNRFHVSLHGDGNWIMGRPSIISANVVNYRAESNGFCKGPRRVVCFCLLGVVFPVILVSVPLFMRFIVYGSSTYHLNPSDMRIMDQKISTIWCRSEAVRLNTTFTAYETIGEPELVKSVEPLMIQKNLIVPDDHKEYWGFYLLKGSTFRISACARHKGGTLLIVKGRHHLHHCAYIGNEDSDQESDATSDSHSSERNPSDIHTNQPKKKIPGSTRVSLTPNTTSSQEEMSIILNKIRSYVKNHPKGYRKLKKNLVNWMLLENNSTEIGNSIEVSTTPETKTTADPLTGNSISEPSEEPPHRIRHARSRHIQNLQASETGSILRKRRHDSDVRKNTDSGENGAFEDLEDNNDLNNRTRSEQASHERKQTPTSIWEKEHSHHTGQLNMTDANDGSDSESESSYSSSEEALAKCEGIVANFNLLPVAECGVDNSGESSSISTYFNATVNVTGYYYFIFGSENEKRDNFIQAKFELEKYEYVLPEPMVNCTGVTECKLDFGFWSDQKLVISVPQPPINREEIWNEIYVGESDCDPRTGLYMVFILTVPLMILVCAFQ